jgi:CheY-like chemotaxis protein
MASPSRRPVLRAGAGRVLIVEDDADSGEMLRFALELDGYEVNVADDGLAAVQMALSVRPEVVIIDLGLPGIDGYEVARRIRATEAGRRMRLIALSGYGQAEDRRRSQAAGFDAHLVKPVEDGTLAEAIQAPPPPSASADN